MLKIEYVVNSIFDSMTWLLSETEGNQVWLVDCGDPEPILQIIGEKSIAGVLLTHAHFDHMYGLPAILDHFPNCKIFTNAVGKETLADAKQNMSFYHESPVTVEGDCTIICKDGGVIELFDNIQAAVYETPGHHPSCLTFVVGDFLFSGDAYIPGEKIVTYLPKGDKNKAKESLRRITELAQGKTILCGHKVL